MLVFSLDIEKFFAERTFGRAEVGWRRNHIALGIGIYMFVYGGIDENEKFLSDCWIFEYATFRWSRVEYKGTKPPALAYHCAELVVEFDKLSNPIFNIYKSPEMPVNRNTIKKLKYEGVYIFGGLDENKNYTNDLRILRVGRKPCEWVYPKISGVPPVGRINATINYYADLNTLVMHGGRNDKEKQMILNDFWVLDLEQLNWIKASFSPTVPYHRTDHSSVIYGDKLLILGGNNPTKFHYFDFCIVYLDLYTKRRPDKLKTNPHHNNDNNLKGSLEVSNNLPSITNKIISKNDFNINNILIGNEMTPPIEKNKLINILKLNSGL